MRPYKFLRENPQYGDNKDLPILNFDFASLYPIQTYVNELNFLRTKLMDALKIPAHLLMVED